MPPTPRISPSPGSSRKASVPPASPRLSGRPRPSVCFCIQASYFCFIFTGSSPGTRTGSEACLPPLDCLPLFKNPLMITDISIKKKIIACLSTLALSVLSFLLKGPIMEIFQYKVVVPLWVFPLIVGLSIASVFFVRWLLLFKDPKLKMYRLLIKPGRQYGIMGGYDNITAIEWSWINPKILIAQTKDGNTIRVHYSVIMFYA